jgi:hypothetical protein
MDVGLATPQRVKSELLRVQIDVGADERAGPGGVDVVRVAELGLLALK